MIHHNFNELTIEIYTVVKNLLNLKSGMTKSLALLLSKYTRDV